MSLQKLMINYASYNLWANQRLIDYVSTKPEENLHAEVKSSYPGILKTFHHIFVVEEFWLDVISQTGKAPEWPNFEGLEKDVVFSAVIQQSEAILRYVKSLSEAALSEIIPLDTPWVKGELERYEFIQHLFNHSTFHRGQVVTIGRVLGFTDAPMTDYNYFNMATVKREVASVNG